MLTNAKTKKCIINGVNIKSILKKTNMVNNFTFSMFKALNFHEVYT